MEVADKLAILSKGEFVAYDSPRNIFENPGNLSTARFIFKDNIVGNKLIKKTDIEIGAGDAYKIVDKVYKGDYFTYKVDGKYDLLIDSTKEYFIDDRVGIEINRVIDLEEKWKR